MALYYTLAVYKSSYDLIFKIFNITKNFVREYKYTVGEKLKKEIVSIIKNIYRANKSADKTPAIEAARENLEVVRLYIRLLRDFGQMSLKNFVDINLNIEDVSKQLTSWQNYEKARLDKQDKRQEERKVEQEKSKIAKQTQTQEKSKTTNEQTKEKTNLEK